MAYAVILICVFAFVLVLFVWTLMFHISLLDLLIGVNAGEEYASVSEFELDKFIPIAKKLNITFTLQQEETLQQDSGQGGEGVEKSVDESKVTEEQGIEESLAPVPYDISLQILNGARLWGAAGSWKEKFRNAGFIEVEIGSAPGDEVYTGVELTYRPSRQAVLPRIKDVLHEGGFAIDAIRENTGSEEGEYDIVIIIGR